MGQPPVSATLGEHLFGAVGVGDRGVSVRFDGVLDAEEHVGIVVREAAAVMTRSRNEVRNTIESPGPFEMEKISRSFESRSASTAAETCPASRTAAST